MPCLEVVAPKMNSDKLKTLTENLTVAFQESTGMDASIFGIQYRLYDSGEAASGGKLCDGSEERPFLHLLLYCPRLARSVKQKVVSLFTKAFTDGVGNDKWKPVIHICEHPYDNVGVDGKLLSDSFEACAKASFYYDLPKE